MQNNKEPIYPVEPWSVTETGFDVANNYRNETTFSLSNGYLGTRGTYEEGYPFDEDTGLEGNFVNGFFEREEIRYGEANFGSPKWSQTLLNLPNLKETRLQIGEETFSMQEGSVSEYHRTLYLKDGGLERSLVWTAPSGKKVQITIRRLVSFARKNIMAICYQATPLNFSGSLTFCSRLDADVENHTRKTNPIVDYGPFGRRLEPVRLREIPCGLYYEGITKGSKLTAACGFVHRLFAADAEITGRVRDTAALREDQLQGLVTFCCSVSQGVPITLEKMIAYSTSLDMPAEELEGFLLEQLHAAAEERYAGLEAAQRRCLHSFWEKADLNITGDRAAAILQGIRFNLFQIFQSPGRDGKTGMGAKGLSGEGYEGHYFWDTEMYVMPVFTFLEPEVSRALLDFRYHTLDQARERARILGHPRGALFPWRTINGEEASTYYPLGTAQYHINADIAYALSQYLQVTGDRDYLEEKGAELLIETARVWADVGSFADCRGGKYCICDVTGPDEYNVLVDNNFYTNFMARENLRDALRAVDYMRRQAPRKWEVLRRRIGFQEKETQLWQQIVENMYFPYDEERKIYPLDDGFLMRKPWDESRIPPEKRAWLYENYHPLFIMRHRMSKQADSLIAMFLHSNQFTTEEIRRNYDFYQEVTLHHSSLSTCIFGIVACDIGRLEDGYTYFSQSARMDLDDCHNNFYAGIHAANMAGTWLAIVCGFAGVRCQEGILRCKPQIPKEWTSYRFQLQYRNSLIHIEVTKEQAALELIRGESVKLMVFDHAVELRRGEQHIEKLQSDIL